jgi:glycine/serine hydroxymethyltransferase
MSGIKETKPLSEIDPEMFKLMQQEYDRQIGGLELIASEVSALSSSRGQVSLGGRSRFAEAGRLAPLLAPGR